LTFVKFWPDLFFPIFASPGLVGNGFYILVGSLGLHKTKKHLAAKKAQTEDEGFELASVQVAEEVEMGGTEHAERTSGVWFEQSRPPPAEWYAADSSSIATSSQLPAYSRAPSEQDYELHVQWRRSAEDERGEDREQLKHGVAESRTGCSSIASSSLLPAYRSSISASLSSEELRRIDVQAEKRSWCSSSR
jgi:hypothetical protein